MPLTPYGEKRERIIWTSVAVAAILAILVIYACVPDAPSQAQTREQLYQGIPLDAHLLELDKRALEAAYADHLKLLFSVWLKDDVSVVTRINAGLRNARRAYADAAAKIEERERALKAR